MAEYTSPAQTGRSPDNTRLRYCAIEPRPPRQLPESMPGARMRAILAGASKWVNGTVLRYWFDGGAEAQRAVVRTAFDQWRDVGIGLEFQEVAERSEAEVRIGFRLDDGSWSYVGRDVLDQPQDERTMNFGWDLAADDYGLTTALHEIGHTLGMPHEHQNPFAGIVWDEEAVYAFLGGSPNNWDRATTFNNVLRKLEARSVTGSDWDPSSIMEYDFPAGLVRTPEKYRTEGIHPPGTLSALDSQFAATWYPPLAPTLPSLEPFASVPERLEPGEQVDFEILPDATRRRTFSTSGASDTVMVLFEEVDGELRYVIGDDDSGEDRNSRFRAKLFRGRRYVLRVRLYYAGESGAFAVMYW
ncbi:M12 family metallopeptidase [Cellulomonas fimi]|uniref:Peptidase metallopeptidase domain-containing protein n=1 Tax=Cellulomonas fimi TaxID=1708 RepID=A0A7Y0QGT5_CELFI|nr:M12 family metallopeptidase [Cellulomonas fimi]NMR19443.1 hypothetical protein [Cellulomonas fimi]